MHLWGSGMSSEVGRSTPNWAQVSSQQSCNALNQKPSVTAAIKKLDYSFVGPLRVSTVISPVAYRLDLLATWQIHLMFHISLLELYWPSDPVQFPGYQKKFLPPNIINSEEEYEVEAILDKCHKSGHFEYLIKWAGYPLYLATWELTKNLHNCDELMQEFEKMGPGSMRPFHTRHRR